MNKIENLNDVVSRLPTLSVARKQLFLAKYASEITILARSHFVDKDYELARLFNESVHRITGYVASLAESPESAAHESFINMLVKGASQKGLGKHVVKSLR